MTDLIITFFVENCKWITYIIKTSKQDNKCTISSLTLCHLCLFNIF